MNLYSDFTFGQLVYLRCRADRVAGMVTGIHVRPVDCMSYAVTWGDGAETTHYAFELATDFQPDYGGI
jgi:hypothetical protein